MNDSLNNFYYRQIQFSNDIGEVIKEVFESVFKKTMGGKTNFKISDSKKIAEAVLKLSDFYTERRTAQSRTPWNEEWAVAAYIAYYFPLNLIRSQAVFAEANRFNFFDLTQNIIDFGSGLGSGSLPFLRKECSISEVQFIEISEQAREIHKIILEKMNLLDKKINFQWQKIVDQKNNFSERTLGIFSYSLTELENLPEWIFFLDQIMIIEPSTRSSGRNLMKIRELLINKGWQIIAPCTHQKNCPLLCQSNTDWCHDRVFWNRPDWFEKIESYLPIKNPTLTFSYLLAVQNNCSCRGAFSTPYYENQNHHMDTEKNNVARVVGDSLPEKGKTRQLVCKDDKRQFLTWMQRDGNFFQLPRGVLIQWPEQVEIKSNEVRLRVNPKIL